MTDKIGVVVWGLGAMGSGIAKVLLEKEGVEITGAIDSNPAKTGLDLGQVLGLERELGVSVTGDPASVLKEGTGNVVLLATSSFVDEVWPQIRESVTNGYNVITIAEQMAQPGVSHPDLAREMDALARKYGVTVLGTGINPGFVLDTLIIALTGACAGVKKIRATRVNDLSAFGPTVMRTQGVGSTPREFAEGLAQGSIVGHIGFERSIALIAGALGWNVTKVEQEREPIISKVYRKTAYAEVQPGMAAGCRHIARAYVDGLPVIELIHPQQVKPELEGVETGDYIEITGTPDINMAIRPEIPGGTGTAAVAVNMIPKVLRAAPGLVCMSDLSLPGALMGNVARMVAGGRSDG